MKKEIARPSGLLPLLLLLALPAVVQAQWIYSTNYGTITIYGYTGPGGAVVIPDRINGRPVSGIAPSAFYACTNLTSVTIGTNVTFIGDEAFGLCRSLTNVTIGNSVTSIGDEAFCYCGLTSVTVPSSVTSVLDEAFLGSGSLRGVYFEGNAPSLGSDVFAYDNSDVRVYYLPGTTGWGAMFGGLPTALWVQGPHAATATPIVTNGLVTGASITDQGWGYTNTPGIRIIGGGGTNAEAVAVVTNGVVIAVNVLNPGDGYTNAPVIVIAPPFIPQPTMGIVWLTFPLPVIGGSMAQLMQLGFGGLSPYDNYQLQFAPVPGGVWSNFAIPFLPTSTVSTQSVIVTGNAGFFRVKYLP